MRSNNGLFLIRVVKTLGVAEIRDVVGGNVVAHRDGEVGPLPVVRNLRVDRRGLLGVLAKVGQQFSRTLGAVLVLAERVYDPDLAGADGTGTCQSWYMRLLCVWGT